MTATPVLDSLKLPEGVRDLSSEELIFLAAEIRAFLIESVSKTGGHLAPSLGVVELSIALHHVFVSPHDKIVWDVGHQSYAHKILTGRKEAMNGLRQYGGISGFTKRSESPHDVFGAGHASTSISAALGMALAMQQQNNRSSQAIAVIGDGALTGGMAFEALNHAGALDANLLVVLNDNEMSISENVGAMSLYLGRILSSRPYSKMRTLSQNVLGKLPKVWEFAQRAEEHLKGMVVPGTLFEELGFNYVGPLDGHDIELLVRALTIMQGLQGPQLLHIITKKGKGFEPAEQDPVSYHGVGKLATNGDKIKSAANRPSYTEVFGQWLVKQAAHNHKIVAITPAMCEGSGLVQYAKEFPTRFYDVGIAEQHALTLAAGFACEGFVPIVAIYSTFLQRAYDQLIHDIAIQNLPVIFAIDRAGIVGADGPTHAGILDLSFLRCVPNMMVLAPKDGAELVAMLDFAVTSRSPIAIRYPRGEVPKELPLSPLQPGKAEVLRTGKAIVIMAFGTMVTPTLTVAQNLDASLLNMRFVKPLDGETIKRYATTHDMIVTIEENVIAGGAGSAVQEYINQQGINIPVCNLGLEDSFPTHGDSKALLALASLDAAGIEQKIMEFSNDRKII